MTSISIEYFRVHRVRMHCGRLWSCVLNSWRAVKTCVRTARHTLAAAACIAVMPTHACASLNSNVNWKHPGHCRKKINCLSTYTLNSRTQSKQPPANGIIPLRPAWPIPGKIPSFPPHPDFCRIVAIHCSGNQSIRFLNTSSRQNK